MESTVSTLGSSGLQPSGLPGSPTPLNRSVPTGNDAWLAARLARRVSLVAPSMIRAVSRVAERYPDAINLGQGTPAGAPPRPVIRAAQRALARGHNQYTNVWGSPRLRRAIVTKYEPRLGFAVDPDRQVTVTCGVTEALFAAVYALVDEGDEVLLFEPRYDNYVPAVVWNGGVPRFVQMDPPRGTRRRWRLDPDRLWAAVTPRTKVMVLNTPHNPSGKVFDIDELEIIADLSRRTGVIVVTDEIYEHLLFGGRRHVSIASLPGMRERTITISGLSKAYDATGWRIAWLIAPPILTDAIRKTHDFLTLCAPAPMQEAGCAALELPEHYYDKYRMKYDRRRRVLERALQRAGLEALPIEGAYYLMADATEVCRGLGIINDLDLADFMIRRVGVAAIPGSNFMTTDPKDPRIYLRFSFCKTTPTLSAAGDKLGELSRLTSAGYRARSDDFATPGIRQMLYSG
jgi:aspartate/methionine/tyrosine aminotransferase